MKRHQAVLLLTALSSDILNRVWLEAMTSITGITVEMVRGKWRGLARIRVRVLMEAEAGDWRHLRLWPS